MADAGDLKSPEVTPRVGSNPTSGTKIVELGLRAPETGF